MGILTSPKLMLPSQIARAIQLYFVSIQRNAWVIPPAQRPSAQRIVSRMRAPVCAEDSACYVNLGSGRQLESSARDATQFKKPNQRFFDQIVRARRSCGNANNGRPVRQTK